MSGDQRIDRGGASSASAEFSGRRALVTGGASGIGRASAELLRAGGAEVVLLDHPAASDAALAAAEAIGARVVLADAGDEAAVDAAVAEAATLLGGVPDLLVCSAGVYPVAPLLEISGGEWDRVLGVNLRGCFLVGRAVARGLLAGDGERSGAIVNVASLAATNADAGEPAGHYAASKAGLLGLTRQMAAEWGPRLRVNAVSPGVIETPMLRITDDPAVAEEYLATRVPLRRLGSAAEVAEAIVFLLSERASYVTGAVLPVDGGVTTG